MIDSETGTTRVKSSAAEAKAQAAAVHAAGASLARQFADNLSEAWANVLVAVDAQVNIWSMKVVRMAILAALALPVMLAGIALVVYGFVLLNSAFDMALQWPNYPHWFSPVIRGGIYFGVPLIGLLVVLFTSVGSGTPKPAKSKDKSTESCNA